MAKETEKVSKWKNRIKAAEKSWNQWYEKFQVKKLQEYYEGFQWPEGEEGYTVNLMFPFVETRKPSLLFFEPKAKVHPRPARSDDKGTVDARARLREDTLNTLVQDPNTGFSHSIQLSLHESFFGYGVIETGYDAEFVDNPRASAPELADESKKSERDPLDQLEKIPENERVYVKRIPFTNFRVPFNAKNRLQDCDWCCYEEYFHVSDLKKDDRLSTKDLKASGYVEKEHAPELDDKEKTEFGDLVLIYKIYDLRLMKRHIIAEGHRTFLLQDEPLDRNPFSVLRYHERLDEFYPIPPLFNLLNPQDQLNQAREMRRIHRKRALRKFLMKKGALDESDLMKLEGGPDMTIVESNIDLDNALRPILDAQLDPAIFRDMEDIRMDFIEISGQGSEQRGVSTAETATQASIIDSRARIRENFQRLFVGQWVSSILTNMLEVVENDMSLNFWIMTNVDLTSMKAPEEAMRVAGLWKQITSDTLGELTYDVSVDIDALSPVAEATQRESWNQVLALLSNVNLLMMLSQSPTLLRKTLNMHGVRSGLEIDEIQRVGDMVVKMFMQQQQQGMGSDTPAGPGSTPDAGQMDAQLAQQVGMTR